jgi:serine/threonine-protein kinase RsbT
MTPRPAEELPLRNGEDLMRIRQAVRTWVTEIGFSLVDQTKFVTAASEIARNALVHGGADGKIRLELIANGLRVGLQLVIEDRGKGIPDIPQALTDGFTTAKGMGLGLGGAKRLVDEFAIASQVGEGTRITLVKWRSGSGSADRSAGGLPARPLR